VAQPPFAVTDTELGTAADPLTIQSAFVADSADAIANSYGVDKNYDLGVVQTWNADVSKDLRQVWNLGAGYTHTRGSSLDIVRAPNRGPDGLRIPGVQPFLWQTSEGSSKLDALSLRVRRRPVRGLGGGLSYTLAKSRDNASTIGGGGTVVAQNDQDLDAEWGPAIS
jgi:trimeric autotransporter adhesin